MSQDTRNQIIVVLYSIVVIIAIVLCFTKFEKFLPSTNGSQWILVISIIIIAIFGGYKLVKFANNKFPIQ